MKRREFIEKTGIVTAGAAVSATILNASCSKAQDIDFSSDPNVIAARNSTPTVAVAVGKKWSELAGAVLKLLGGMEAFVKAGQTVVIKPNIAWDRNPDQAADTHPDVVRSVIDLCLAANAKKILIFDRPCDEARRSYTNSGMEAMAASIKDKRVVLSHVDDRKFVNVKMNGVQLDSWDFYKDALDADVYINMPIAKHHGLAKITAGMKNIMGILGKRRQRIHWSFEDTIVDLNLAFRPTLTITDGTRILLRNGPQGGNMEDVAVKNTLIASTDIAANDAVVAKKLFNTEPEQIPHIARAYERGVGQIKTDKINLVTA